MIARMTEAWIVAADSCFCHFGVTLPYLEVSWHTKEVGKFSTQAASRGGGRIMTVRAMFHICMELWGIFICLICAGGIFIATPQKTRRTRIKILMQIACMLLLGTDALSWYFRVDADKTAYYMVRISNFSVFCINYIFMSFFATYVWLTVSKHQHRKPAALRAVYALSVIGILLLIITQFTGLFYYFDDHNLYHRGNFYLLSQAIAVLGIALCLFMLISYRKNLDRIIFLSMMSFFVLPVLATIYQARHTVFHCNVWRL